MPKTFGHDSRLPVEASGEDSARAFAEGVEGRRIPRKYANTSDCSMGETAWETTTELDRAINGTEAEGSSIMVRLL